MEPTKIQGTIYPFASIGKGLDELDAFDDAEVNAGIEALNAIRYTSFVPVGPKGRWKVDKSRKMPRITNGMALPMPFQAAYSSSEYISAAIAIGLNEDPNMSGLIMEYAQRNISEDDLQRKTIASLERAFERRKIHGWKLGEVITRSIGILPSDGMISCALVGAVYFPEELK